MSNSNNTTLTRHFGGRSTSQISIYDYPEHLNPFYEAENHKRLRFWHIGRKNGSGGSGSGGSVSRRGSFSLDGLREMWAFKSFKMKKKSSVLGINKTSESPPPLRRSIDPSEANYGTYDPRMRHTVGLGTIDNSFQRNVPYRSSLQDMRYPQALGRSNGTLEFTRNNRYRSTMQSTGCTDGTLPVAAPRRYVYGGSVTPQPRSRYSDHNSIGCNDKNHGISRGSSQTSLASTNPFEDCDDDDGHNHSNKLDIETERGQETTPTKKTPRKKRRAPPPPVPIPKQIDEEPSSSSVTPLTAASQINQSERNENTEIANLTAEIEDFVKTTTGDKEESTTKVQLSDKAENQTAITVTITQATPTEEDKYIEIDTSNDREVVTKEKVIEVQENAAIVKIEETVETVEEKPKVSQEKIEVVVEPAKPETEEIHSNKIVESTVVIKEETISNENTKGDSKSVEHTSQTTNETIEKVQSSFENNKVDETKVQNVELQEYNELRSFELRPEDLPEPVVELRITESEENLVKPEEPKVDEKQEKVESPNKSDKSMNGASEKYQIRYVPLKDTSTSDLESPQKPEKRVVDYSTLPHDKRRSVKDIIESINRSQSLLKVNQDQTEKQENTPKEHIEIRPPPRKSSLAKQKMIENYKELKRSSSQGDSPTNGLSSVVEKTNGELNNNNTDDVHNYNNDEIFKKCTIKKDFVRESSPTAANLDWNPVPKPKRVKNFNEIRPTPDQPERENGHK